MKRSNTIRFVTNDMTTTAPVHVTADKSIYVASSSRYLPETEQVTDQNWRVEVTGVQMMHFGADLRPVINASTIKGALRHISADYVTRAATDKSPDEINLLYIGGILNKNKEANGGSLTVKERLAMRDLRPHLGLYGRMDFGTWSGAIQVETAMPVNEFRLDRIPLVRTAPNERMDIFPKLRASAYEEYVVRMSQKLEIEDGEKKTGKPKSDKANTSDRQMNYTYAIPAGAQFKHAIKVTDATDAEVGLLWITLQLFLNGKNAGRVGGRVSYGCGGGLTANYAIESFNEETFAWEPVDQSEMARFVKAYKDHEATLAGNETIDWIDRFPDGIPSADDVSNIVPFANAETTAPTKRGRAKKTTA